MRVTDGAEDAQDGAVAQVGLGAGSRAPGAAGGMRVLCAVCAVSVLSCARIEPPPGGPPDTQPPRLIAVFPESVAVLPRFDGEVEFRFDEVVSEGGSPSQGLGTGDLERLVLLSPDTAVPDVSWKRSRLTVRPAGGWKPDRVYRVQLLPGITDLRNNRTDDSAVVTFSTGAPLPDRTLRGRVWDWSSSRPAAGALVTALLLPDSLPYRILADSSGRFALGPIPDGEYVVFGTLDANTNRRRDGREAFDSVRVAAGRDEVPDLWAFVHDTAPPRLRTASVTDSVTATVELTQPLAPDLKLGADAVTVLMLPDSTPVTVAELLTAAEADSARARRDTARTPADTGRRAPPDSLRPRADTARPPADTARPARPGVPPRAGAVPRQAGEVGVRPPLSDRLVLRMVEPWRPDTRYTIEIRGVRNVTGVTADVRGGLAVPARTAAPRAADTTRARPDSAPVPDEGPPPDEPPPQ